MLAISSWIVLLIYMAPRIFAQNCHLNISDAHYMLIDEMISTQANLCKIPVKILNRNVTDTCDFWALVHEVDGLLKKFIFTPNTANFNRTYDLKQIYYGCLNQIQSDEKKALDIYLQTSDMTATEILTKVKDSLKKLKVLKASDLNEDCISYYETHGQHNNDVLKGPHCTCPSPTPSISSSEASQTSLSYLSELASSTHTSYFLDTSSLAEGMSGSYPEKPMSPQKNSQGLDSSPFISTKTPSDLKPLFTTLVHSYTGAKEQSGAYTNSPLTNSDFTVHSTEFTKGLHEPSYVSLNPSQTRTDSEQVSTSTSDATSEEERNEKLSQSNLHVIIIAFLVVLVLLLLCGFLYYRHQYRVLKRRLSINCDVNLTRNPGAVLPEERVQLHIIECDVV
ncbi:uncharacterized protein LOC130356398 isoform X2 [Hyla sarda]|uniref:uncharacterized protein LOC130356398 isoform X2 n=1 Tax=Hyla sarda TaxID=327740 RepID=UPI0024C2BD03|nr:uncharacterized protein LOC130356398 isoform X2 [Hyla sarda]